MQRTGIGAVVHPTSIFLSCFLYVWFLMPVQWSRRAEWLLSPHTFHKQPPSFAEGEQLLLSVCLATLVTATSLLGLSLRILSAKLSPVRAVSSSKPSSLQTILFNDYAVLFTSLFIVVVSFYLWCYSAFSSQSGVTFHLAQKFFTSDLELGGRACARITAGFFASILSLSYLDPLSCASIYGHQLNSQHSSSIWLLSVFGLGGLGGVGGATFLIASDLLDQFFSVPTWTLLSKVQWHILVPLTLGMTAGSLTVFTAICSFLHYHFYVDRADDPKSWKIQHDRYLSPADHYHEIMLACCNLVLASLATSFVGYWIYTGGHTALYVWTSFDDLWYIPLSILALFFYIDINAYYQHRLFHFPFLYKHFHKWHHRYKSPTAWSATAIHPFEFLLFQFQLMWPTFVFPLHAAVYGVMMAYVWFYGILDHSGIYLDSIWPWQVDSKFHDDHHRYFHCQFGQNLNWWDRLHGTMRNPDLKYNEDTFMY